MATILFTDAIENPDLLDGFDPSSDILLFTEATAADVSVSGDDSSTTFSTSDGSVSLDVGMKTITSGSTGFVRFIDGGALVIGDGTVATVADDLSNNVSDATPGADQVRGLGGNDTIYGGDGADLLYGNAGNDSFWAAGPTGADTVYGGQGDDRISYVNSISGITAYGNLGDDSIFGADQNNGDDLLYGGQGDDTLEGADGDDTIYGNADDDYIHGSDGSNLMFGGQGNDTIQSSAGGSISYGNLGNDLILAGQDDGLVFGGQGNDTLYGGDGDDDVFGNADADLFVNMNITGEDAFTGGAGSDTLNQDLSTTTSTSFEDFNGEEDVISVSGVTAADFAANAAGGSISNPNERGFLLAGPDIILEGSNGTITLVGAAGQTLHGENLVLADSTVFVYNVGGAAGSFEGSDGDDFMIAGDAGDTLTSGTGVGNDTLIGGDGNDLFQMEAGFGNSDYLYGGDGTDSLTATIDDATNFSSATDSIEQFSFSWGSGTGDAFISLIQDTAFAVDASSFTVGQDFGLFLNSSTASGNVMFGTGDDTFLGSDATVAGDTVAAGDGDDTVYGYAGNDVIDGEEGVDYLSGGAGMDTLTGGTGADVFRFSASDSSFTLTGVDKITDFVGGSDVIQFSGGGAVVFDERLTDLSGSTDLADAAQDAYTAAASVAASDAVLFVFGGRTYAYVNDTTAGFSSSDDLLVDITGFTGTITDASFI